MAGCRSITENEEQVVLSHLKTPRDKMLFILGLKTGFRISELLSLTIKDVFSVELNTCLPRIKVFKRNMKGKGSSREMLLHPAARVAIVNYISSLGTTLNPEQPLFLSRNGENKVISRHGAHKTLKTAYKASGLTGCLATHSMRKTFARKVHKAFKQDIFMTQKALGHKSILGTAAYLEADQGEIDTAVLSA